VSIDDLVRTAFVAAYASGGVWFYLHCVRPGLLWFRARAIAHAAFAVAASVPVLFVVLAPESDALPLAAVAAWAILVIGFTFPALATRLTGGSAPPSSEYDRVQGWLGPAGHHLDLGDLDAARLQVDEARRHATVRTQAYVDLWAALVEDEARRRDGERISRYARLEEIWSEQARLVLGDSRARSLIEALVVAAVAVAVFVSIAIRYVG
jgi:hypothetical protein